MSSVARPWPPMEPLKLEAHPAADVFPVMEGEAFDKLKTDIAIYGLREPICLCDGKILDGRNRYRACIELGIVPQFQVYDGDSPVAYSWSLNGTRRHLSTAQLAAIAVRMLPPLEAEARARMQAGHRPDSLHPPLTRAEGPRNDGEASAKAGKLVGVSRPTVNRARFVHQHDAELFGQIERGEMSPNRAYDIARGRVPRELGNQARRPPDTPRCAARDTRIKQIRELTEAGNDVDQIAAKLGITGSRVRLIAYQEGLKIFGVRKSRLHASRVIQETVSMLAGCALGLQTLGEEYRGVTLTDAARWLDSLTNSLQLLHRLQRDLRGLLNGKEN